jgi:protein TonB
MSLTLKLFSLALIGIGTNGFDVQDAPAKFINGPRPDFHLCRKPSSGEKLTSTVIIAISKTGAPDEVKIAHTSGDDCLDAVALATARQYRFMPATRGGTPISSHVHVMVDFERR